MSIDLRCFTYVDILQPQTAGFLGTVSQGYHPLEGESALFIEVSPGMDINKVTDIALKSTSVTPGMMIVYRRYGALELHHADPELCIPLLVAHDLEAIVADWQEWALLYDIPMLMVEADGAARAVDFQPHRVSAANDEAGPRRRKATRPIPRLTVRMEDGKLGVALKLAGRAVAA